MGGGGGAGGRFDGWRLLRENVSKSTVAFLILTTLFRRSFTHEKR